MGRGDEEVKGAGALREALRGEGWLVPHLGIYSRGREEVFLIPLSGTEEDFLHIFQRLYRWTEKISQGGIEHDGADAQMAAGASGAAPEGRARQ